MNLTLKFTRLKHIEIQHPDTFTRKGDFESLVTTIAETLNEKIGRPAKLDEYVGFPPIVAPNPQSQLLQNYDHEV